MASFLAMLLLFGCAEDAKEVELQDGIYSAQFKEYDSYGYKDYLRITVEDGVVTKVDYNAMNADGQLRTEDEKYEADMSKLQETYPRRYTADLANQLLETGDITKVDDIAGATWSSESFKALYSALLAENIPSGDTTLLLVDNVPAK